MPISDELKAVYTTAPTARYYIETLELNHASFVSPMYFTNQRDGWTGTLEDTVTVEVFTYLPFALIPPRAEGEGAVSLQVAIDNVDRVLMDTLEELALTPTEPIITTYRIYLSDDSGTVQNDPPMVLDIQSVTATQHLISFNAGITNLRSRPFPSTVFTVDKYPGLKR
jgi:hypothetical protein